MLSPFQWSGNQAVSPQAAARDRQIAEALLAQNSSVATNPWEGLAQVARAYSGSVLGDRADTAEAEGQAAVAELLMGLGPDAGYSDILGVLGNEWASPEQSAIAQMLFQNQLRQSDPLYQAQMEGALLGNQTAQFELDALRNAPPPLPEAPKTEKMYDPETGREQVMQWDATSGQWVPLGGVQAPKDPLVQVNTGDSMPGLGKLSNDYSYLTDPATGMPIIDPATNLPTAAPVPGSPAAIAAAEAAAAAEAQAGAQITSDLEGAEKTLSSTRNVLDLIDGSDTPVTGTLSRPFAAFSGTPAGRVRSYVNTLQSGVALGAMQRLKEASATGATGFGALSAPELNLLINDIGALDPDNTEPDIFRETVQRIDERAKRVVADIKRNVSPERIAELGLEGLIAAFDEGGGTEQPGQSQIPTFNSPADFEAAPSGTIFKAPDGSIRVKP